MADPRPRGDPGGGGQSQRQSVTRPSETEPGGGRGEPESTAQKAIATASEEKGRGLKKLQARFSENRARLLQMLDREGPIKQLTSWQSFTHDLSEVLSDL
jgi:hypothetical protein